jgi:hypothetical protein
MLVKIEIRCDNAAFEDDFAGEIKRILNIAASKLANGHVLQPGPLSDSNGNKVGFVSVECD